MAISIIQSISSVLLILGILLQNKGTGLGAAFGDTNKITHTKRGAEKFLYNFTIVIAVIFIVSSFLNVLY